MIVAPAFRTLGERWAKFPFADHLAGVRDLGLGAKSAYYARQAGSEPAV